MRFIKTLFWVVLAVVIVVFAVNNWSPVSVLIWPELRADTKLPVLVIGAFLLGLVPTYLLFRATNWRLKRRIRSLEASAKPLIFPTEAQEPEPVQEPIVETVEPAPLPQADEPMESEAEPPKTAESSQP